MKVCVTAYVERLQGDRTMINKAYFTMVAMDEFENPCRVPRLILKTDAERAEFEEFERKRKAIASR
jgi:acyl-CoA hydrolase